MGGGLDSLAGLLRESAEPRQVTLVSQNGCHGQRSPGEVTGVHEQRTFSFLEQGEGD